MGRDVEWLELGDDVVVIAEREIERSSTDEVVFGLSSSAEK